MNSNEMPRIIKILGKTQSILVFDKNYSYESVTYRMKHWSVAKSSINLKKYSIHFIYNAIHVTRGSNYNKCEPLGSC